MRTIRINEESLKSIIAEGIKEVLNEVRPHKRLSPEKRYEYEEIKSGLEVTIDSLSSLLSLYNNALAQNTELHGRLLTNMPPLIKQVMQMGQYLYNHGYRSNMVNPEEEEDEITFMLT